MNTLPAKRVLFLILALPRPTVSVRGLVCGREAMSGTHSTSLLVADGLARRGWDVGMLILNGGRLADTAVLTFNDLGQALSWLGGGRVLWCFHGNSGVIERLRAAGTRPIVWSHIDLSSEVSGWLERDWIEGVVTVSDFCRVALLHHSKHARIGRIYNPLNPFYDEDTGSQLQSGRVPGQAVFAGFIGETKGAHRLFECWRAVRRSLPDARLEVAGSARLYKDDIPLGPYGTGTPEFEKKYIAPLASEFGSLEKAGVHLRGLLSPAELRSLYHRSALGIINLNAYNATETFSCSGVEMAACGLHVFSMASAALPETVGFTGTATLVTDPARLESAFAEALSDTPDPQRIEAQKRQVRHRYQLDRILAKWEELLDAPADHFYRLSGPWQYSKNFRYFAKKAVAGVHAGQLLDRLLALRRSLRNTR